MSKYTTVEYYEVFSPEFMEYLNNSETLSTEKTLNLILARIEQYEEKHNLEFVSLHGNAYVIFKPATT